MYKVTTGRGDSGALWAMLLSMFVGPGCGGVSESTSLANGGAPSFFGSGGSYSNADASWNGLVGGVMPLTPAQMAALQDPACPETNLDGGIAQPSIDAGNECTYTLPTRVHASSCFSPSYVSYVDPNWVNVVYMPVAGQQLLFVQATDKCPLGDGWFVNSNNEIVLCANTCAMTNADGGVIHFYVGCSGPLITC